MVTVPLPHRLLEIVPGGGGGLQMVKFVELVTELQPTVTSIVPVVAPVGTVVVILVAVLAVTIAVVPLNFTMLLAGVGSKLVPVMVTEVPVGPDNGVEEVMVGGEMLPIVLRNTDTVLPS